MLELNQIYNEDCLGERGMCLIPDKSVDMILCDLPYGTTDNVWDSVIPLDRLWLEYKRVIKDNGAILLFGSQPFTTILNASNLEWFRYEWVWVKPNSTGFLNANKMPLKRHELISVFYKESPTYNPQGLVPFGRKTRRGSIGTNWKNTTSNEYVQQFANYPTQLLEFDYDIDKVHPTQKPVELVKYLIRTYTNEGEIVLDNTIGSGTTAVACISTGRNFIGFEKDPEYHRIATERIANVQSALFV